MRAERTHRRPLAPFVEALEEYQALTWSMPAAKRRAVTERLQRCPTAFSPAAATGEGGSSYLPGGDGPRADHFARCVAFLCETAQAHEPVLVVAIDDLQWADEGTLELFVRLLYPLFWCYMTACRVLPLPLAAYMRRVMLPLTPAKRRVVIYDQLNPAYAKYYTREEARRLLEHHGFEDIRLHHRHGISWTVVGTKA